MTDVNRDIGAAPRLAMVAVESIDVDRNYQREIRPALVKKILAKFSWDKFGAVSLTEKSDGRFNITEGQHRWKAACMHPDIVEIPAVITVQLGTEQEAQAFVAINGDRMAVSSVERYWAGLTAGDDRAVAISNVLKAAGCDVVSEQGHYRPNLTNSITAIDRCLQRYGHGATRRALLVIRAAWPNDAHALRGTLITALARIIRANDRVIEEPHLAASIRGESLATLTAHAEGFRKLSGGTAETAIARTIAELYNRGRRSNTIFFGEGR